MEKKKDQDIKIKSEEDSFVNTNDNNVLSDVNESDD